MDVKKITSSVLFASLLVLLASCSYAVLSTLVILSGFNLPTILVGKFFYGWLILAALVLIVWLVYQRKQPKPEKNKLKMSKRVVLLIITGIAMALVTVCYFNSFAVFGLPISLAVILLFQYSWIGLVIETIARRKIPSKSKIVAALVIFAGTILAGGIIGSSVSFADMNPVGILLGLSAATLYAFFVFMSGQIETQMPPLHKSFLIATVAVIFVILFIAVSAGVPAVVDAFMNVEALSFCIPLGIFGIAVPVFFLAVGAPKISTGMATILNSAELPVEVFLAAVIIAETVEPLRWVGVVIILLGIALPYLLEKKITSGLEN